MSDHAQPLVDVTDLSVEFKVAAREWRAKSQRLRAVDRVTFQIARAETLGLVGESGSGKTTLGRTLVRLYQPVEGSVRFDGVDIASLRGEDLKRFRRRAQMIFQDPYASLNPRMKVGEIIAEPLRIHGVGSKSDRQARVRELLGLVGLPETSTNRFPHAFSGGQRQRIGIARALALAPDFLVCDEPVSALDVSVQAQVINLLADLRDELGVAMLLIAHDLAVVQHAATRVAIMYLGQICEIGPRSAIFKDPLHPYTRSLLSAIPVPDPAIERARQRIVLSGDVPSPITPPSGCRFHTRCPHAMTICREVQPEPYETPDGRIVSCHLVRSETEPESVGSRAGGHLHR